MNSLHCLATLPILATALIGPSVVPQQQTTSADYVLQSERVLRRSINQLSLAGDECLRTASLTALGTFRGNQEDLLLALAKCLNTTDDIERAACADEAWTDFMESNQLINDQYDARNDVCALLGGGLYDPDIAPANFVAAIDNPFLPWTVGRNWTYEIDTDEGLERIFIEVLPATKVIQGVTCTVVRDTVTLAGVLLEDTDDYYAQDVDGNVWYFGEISRNYDEDGLLTDLDGSWESGLEGAKAGIVMFATPVVDTTYRQEFLLDEAEDMGTVLSISATANTAIGVFSDCIQTLDFTPIDPEALEYKFYASGIGLVLEVDPDTGDALSLVDFQL